MFVRLLAVELSVRQLSELNRLDELRRRMGSFCLVNQNSFMLNSTAWNKLSKATWVSSLTSITSVLNFFKNHNDKKTYISI